MHKSLKQTKRHSKFAPSKVNLSSFYGQYANPQVIYSTDLRKFVV